MWKVSWFYEKVHNIANFGGYAAILFSLSTRRGTAMDLSAHSEKIEPSPIFVACFSCELCV